MNEIRAILSEFTPGAAGVWTGVLMFAGWMLREWRENRKLSDADKQARRQGYEKQVQLLTGENRDLAIDLRKLREEYDGYRKLCQAETEQLHRQNMEQEIEISTLRRRVDVQAFEIAQLSPPAPEMERMARSIDSLNEEADR